MWAPTLECASSVFEAADCVVSVEEGSVGEAFGWVDALGDAVVNDGGGVLVQTGEVSITVTLLDGVRCELLALRT